MGETFEEKKLDPEWAKLILYAGISPDKIREFFESNTGPE